jgi:hypothetical protein
MGAFVDLKGQKFGMLTAIERVENDKSGMTRWRFLCDCGQETIAYSRNVKKGTTQSCGCYR